jgi:hypothetical protein
VVAEENAQGVDGHDGSAKATGDSINIPLDDGGDTAVSDGGNTEKVLYNMHSTLLVAPSDSSSSSPSVSSSSSPLC